MTNGCACAYKHVFWKQLEPIWIFSKLLFLVQRWVKIASGSLLFYRCGLEMQLLGVLLCNSWGAGCGLECWWHSGFQRNSSGVEFTEILKYYFIVSLPTLHHGQDKLLILDPQIWKTGHLGTNRTPQIENPTPNFMWQAVVKNAGTNNNIQNYCRAWRDGSVVQSTFWPGGGGARL